ncbi:MAG: hypothetical protein PUE64_07580 [Firmicutes bacterium]|nr:hypothetical protein [Bacillota bacterium]
MDDTHSPFNVPPALSGLFLAFSALTNALLGWSAPLWQVTLGIALVLMALLVLRILSDPARLLSDLASPVTGGILCTFPMGLSFLAAILQRVAAGPAEVLWAGALLLHLVFLLSYSVRFFGKPLSTFDTPAFLVFVGPAAAAVTAPAFSQQALGRGILALTGAPLLVWYPLLLYRRRMVPVPAPQAPLVGIFAAPLPLFLMGVLQSAVEPAGALVLFLWFLSLLAFLAVLPMVFGYLRRPFTPALAAFSFPLVNSSLATLKAAVYLGEDGAALPALLAVGALQLLLAVTILGILLCRFAAQLERNPMQKETTT